MKFVSFTPDADSAVQPGILRGEQILALPYTDLNALIEAGSPALVMVRSLVDRLQPGDLGPTGQQAVWALEEVTLHAPIQRAPSFRDFYAFEQHVAATNANRGREVPAAWYEIPVFYFSNPNVFFGPESLIPYPQNSQSLDYELEVACIIGEPGRDIAPAEALNHIFGFTILNDWSARDLQKQEMSVGLGPAKGKDFANTIGPWIVTPDELLPYATDRTGVYDLEMSARINGVERSRGNWHSIFYSFGQMIARASASVDLLPGDVIGSGTVGTGCLLELTQGEGPWLQPGDDVELEIEALGVLRNRVGAPA